MYGGSFNLSWVDDYRQALSDIQTRTGTGSGSASNSNTDTSTESSSNSWVSEYRNALNKYNDGTSYTQVTSRMTVGNKNKDEEDKEEKKKKRKWYESELFDDGWDFGDVTKAILGVDDDTASLKDLTVGSIKRGYYNSIYGEESFKAMNGSQNQKDEYKKLLESDEYQFAPGNDLAGAVSGGMEQFGQMVRQFTNPRTVAFTGTAVGAAIIAGNAGPQALLPEEIISVPAAATAAFTAGSAASNLEIEAGHAYNEMIEAGISEKTARKVAWGVGGVNAGLELLQIDELVDAYKVTKGSGATKKFTQKIVDELLERGIDVAKETTQEVAQEFVTTTGVQIASMKDKGEWAYTGDEVKDRMKDTAKSSALTFGMMNAPAAVKNTISIASEQKKANSLTKNEQAVVDKVVADRIAEKEKDGAKLSGSEKKKITEAVVAEMEKGYISVDTIAEAIGGEKYNQYKQAADWEASLQNEYDTLNKEFEGLGEKENPNLKDQSRYAELKEMLPDLKKRLDNVKATSTVADQRSQLVKNVFEMSKSDRLAESFYEIERSKQKFDADLSKYDEKQRQHIQDAIDSGVLHNGNRAHEMVDYTAKVSSDTGLNIKYSNTAKIKADGLHPKRTVDLQADGSTTEFDLGIRNLDEGFKPIVKVGSTELSNYKVDFENGKITFDSAPTGNVSVTVEGTEVVDAVYTKDGIVLNVESPKYLEALTGHEVSHSFEKAKNYDNLFNAVKAFAETKGEWESRLAEKQEKYKGIEDADPEREVVADLIGEYLFQGSDFIMDLSTNHRNVFQKIFDEIKYLCKMATAGSQEARKLEAVKHEFEKIYREVGAQKNTADSGVLYGIGKTSKMSYVDQLNMIEKRKMNGSNSLYVGKPSESLRKAGFSDAPFAMNQSDYRKSRREAGNNKHYSSHAVPYEFFENLPKHLSKAPMFIDNGGKVSVITDYGMKDTKGNDSFVIAGVWTNQQMESDTVNLVRSIYPLDDIASRIQRAAEEGKLVVENKNKAAEMLATIGIQPAEVSRILSLAKDTLTQKGENVNYSLSDDSEGRKLSPSVAKRFGNSKVVDENGSLKPVYHGTASGEFTIFDKTKGSVEGDFGSGFYFTDNEADVSEHYEGGGPDFDNKVGRRADEIWNEEPDIEYEEAKERARAELYKGSHKFEVYLNIENPAVVGETMLFNGESYLEQYNEEDYDDYDDYIADVEQQVADDIENIVWEVEKNVDVYSVDGLSDILFEAYYEGGIGIEELKEKINNLYLEDSNGNLVGNEVARQIIESLGYDGIIDPTVSGKWNMDIEDGTTHYIVFKPNQIKAVTNQNPTDNPDIHRSLSNANDKAGQSGYRATLGKDVALQTDDIAPTVSETESVADMFPDDAVPEQAELEQLIYERDQIYSALEDAVNMGSANDVGKLAEEYEALNSKIKELESSESERTGSITDADMPPEMDAPLSMKSENYNPYGDTTLDEITRSTRTFSDMNPGARQYIEEGALGFLYDVNNSTRGERWYNDDLYYSTRGERWYNDDLYYSTGGEQGFGGTARHTADDIAYMKDTFGYTWEEIRKAAEDVAKGEARSAAAKRVEFLIHNRLMEGYTDIDGRRYEPNQKYITFLNESFANENRAEGFNSLLENADQYVPAEEVAPANTLKQATADTMDAPIFESKDKNTVKGQTTMFEPEKPKTSGRVANVLTEESRPKEKSGIGMKAVSALVDKGMVFENLSLETGNMEVQAKWNSALSANTEKKAQYFMENGADGVKPLKEIINTVKKTGKKKAFSDYMYHVHNIDRMSLEERFGLTNKAVFGDTITADVSREKVRQYEKANPEFKAIAEDIYTYNRYLRNLLVENGLISQETADLWENEYPHYVPVRRVDENGKHISVPLDTNKTGVNNPVKRATGGSSDIEPLFNSLAMHAEQTFSAIARNSFGIELKNTLGTTIDAQQNTSSVDNMIDLIEDQESHLLKPGSLHSNPTFTVFENGERVEFEITEDMYDALKPAGKLLGYRNEAVTNVSNWRRNLLTTWNTVFALWRNPVKDLQDVMINSQHAAKTYAQIITPTKDNVIYQIASHGKWAAEYESNGGKGSTYFDSKNKKFAEDSTLKKIIGFPLNRLEAAGEFIEEIPRLAEYIASRKEGRSVDRSMLDASRVTTNFAAGGDVTKFANAHGFTFLNASVQGFSQHVRNFREATKLDGMKGFVKTLAKYTLAGIPGIILNNMVWDDDEEYEELADYVKENYYVVAKTDEGKFIRIPKGRTSAVMQNALEQMQHLITGDDEADFGTFFELFMNNIAPNNPIENNILAPIKQVMDNRAWYGDDLVPSRLQDLPTEEQYDESTDALSKWLGENFDPFDLGPYKINYLIDQYSGGLGDTFLPMMTPEAESGDNTFVGNMLAPWKKELTTDSVLNNKNPGNFYDLKEELDVVSNGKNATEEDKMRSVYMDSVSWEMGDLYAQKREIQNSNLPDDQKYEKVREIQQQINELANNALDNYNNVKIDGAYSEVGDRRFNYDADKDKWYEIKPKNADGSDNIFYVREQLSHDKLGMSYADFWNGKEPPAYFAGKTYYAEYNGKRYDYSEYNGQWYEIEGEYLEKEQNAIKRYGITPEDYWNNTDLYYHADWYFDDDYATNDRELIANTVFGGKRFAPYAAELAQIRGEDNDGDGKTDSGTKKANVQKYIESLKISYGEKIIMHRTLYSSKDDKRLFDQDIIKYLDGRNDLTLQEKAAILKELGIK